DVRVFELFELALRPLDQLHARAGEHLRNADLEPLAAALGQPVTINMDDRRSAGAWILVDDRERRRAHLERIGTELRRDRTREKRFPRSEVAGEVDDGVGREHL